MEAWRRNLSGGEKGGKVKRSTGQLSLLIGCTCFRWGLRKWEISSLGLSHVENYFTIYYFLYSNVRARTLLYKNINRVRISSPRSLPFSLPEKCGILLKVTVDQLTFWLFLPHLPADAPQTASRRNRDYVPTQLALRGDVAPAASPRSGGSVCRVLQRASPQGRCTTFGTTIAFWRFFLYLCTVIH